MSEFKEFEVIIPLSVFSLVRPSTFFGLLSNLCTTYTLKGNYDSSVEYLFIARSSVVSKLRSFLVDFSRLVISSAYTPDERHLYSGWVFGEIRNVD